MANIKGIEVSNEIYNLEDTNARTTASSASTTANTANTKATANETAIAAVQAVIPSSASASNKLATKADIPYEEGTPNFNFPRSTIVVNNAKYIKIGKLVNIFANITVMATQDNNDYFNLLNAPTPSNNYNAFGTWGIDSGTAAAGIIKQSNNSSSIWLLSTAEGSEFNFGQKVLNTSSKTAILQFSYLAEE